MGNSLWSFGRNVTEQDLQRPSSSSEQALPVRRPESQGGPTEVQLADLSSKLAAEWQKLGIFLGLQYHRLEAINMDKCTVEDKAMAMLMTWKQRLSPEVDAYAKLIEALKKCGRMDLASDVAKCSSPENIDRPLAEVAADSCEEALKSHYKNRGSFVQILPCDGTHNKHIQDMYTKLQLVTEDRKLKPGSMVAYDDIFLLKTRDGDSIKICVLSGLAGRGKSTLFIKMTCDWALEASHELGKFKLVFLLQMHALEQTSDLMDAIFDQLLDTSIDRSALEVFIRNNSDKVCILLDGFDEFMTTSLSENRFGSLLKTLNQKMYRGCHVLVTTRPSHFNKLVTKELVQKPFTHVRVEGFSEKDIEEYVHKFYSENDELDEAKRLFERIDSSNLLTSFATSPMLLLLMCLLWGEAFTLPETMSRLYFKAVKYIFQRKRDNVSEEEVSMILIEIGKIGLNGLLSPDQVLAFKESEFAQNQSALNMALEAGLLTKHRVLKGLDTHNSIQFIHKTFQEFCAAKYLQSLVVVGNHPRWLIKMRRMFKKSPFEEILDQIGLNCFAGFRDLLRFTCGDNEACTNRILQVFMERPQQELSFDTAWGKLALHCYFERQSNCLPPVQFIQSFLTDEIRLDEANSDDLTSFKYFVNQVNDQGSEHLARVQNVEMKCVTKTMLNAIVPVFSAMTNMHTLTMGMLYRRLRDATLISIQPLQPLQLQHLEKLHMGYCSLTGADMPPIGEALSHLPNLFELDLYCNGDLGGTAASWAIHLNQLKHLKKLHLGWCSLTSEDMPHIAEALSHLPNLVGLYLDGNDLGGTAASWDIHLNQMKHLKKLHMGKCSLTGEDMPHIAWALSHLPNLVELNLFGNDGLGGTAASWSIHLNQMKHLKMLAMTGCSLTGEDKKYITEALRHLPEVTFRT